MFRKLIPKNLPKNLAKLKGAYVTNDFLPFAKQLGDTLARTPLEAGARIAGLSEKDLVAFMQSLPFKHSFWGFWGRLTPVEDAFNQAVHGIVSSTPPSTLDAEQRALIVCNQLGIPYAIQSLEMKNFLFKVVTSSSRRELERLFSRNSDNGYEFPCNMYGKQTWTLVHFLSFMFTVQSHMLRGYSNDEMPSIDVPTPTEIMNKEHYLLVKSQIDLIYLKFVSCGVFTHSPEPLQKPF